MVYLIWIHELAGQFWRFSFMENQVCFQGLHAVFLIISMIIQVAYTCIYIVYLIFATRTAGLTTR